MTSTQMLSARPVGAHVLAKILDEYSGRFDISGQSKILASNARLAKMVQERFPGEVGQWQPTFTYTNELQRADGSGVLQGPVEGDENSLKKIEISSFTHAIVSLNVEDGRAAFRMLKWVHWALIPKGLLIVVVPTKESLITALHAAAEVNTEEIMWQMTPARPPILQHAVQKASFEPSKIRILEKKVLVKNSTEIEAELSTTRQAFDEEAADAEKTRKFEEAAQKQLDADGGLVQEAYVIIARRWDQLTA